MPKTENKRKDREGSSTSLKDLHNYANTSTPAVVEAPMEAADFALSPLPESPLQSPLTKKGKPASDHDDPDDRIVTKLSAIIIARGDALEKAVTMKIEGLKKTIDFVCEEVKDIKKRVKDAEAKAKMEEQRVASCETRIAELERYSRRWNLKLAGFRRATKRM
ncbi:hypothetical protein WMY93_007439 [Mugilogobius chulae]|uniref:Uncharacterized protein n=1 Tax=Mugilogobius chulae TaxID=88201 RepID=A0AAW0PCY7_9GOBI